MFGSNKSNLKTKFTAFLLQMKAFPYVTKIPKWHHLLLKWSLDHFGIELPRNVRNLHRPIVFLLLRIDTTNSAQWKIFPLMRTLISNNRN